MDVLLKCRNLDQLLANEINLRRLNVINQDNSKKILDAVSIRLRIRSSVANLFHLQKPLYPKDYITFIKERIGQFGKPQISTKDLERVEEELFSENLQEIPILDTESVGINNMLSQMTEWQKKNAVNLDNAKESIINDVENNDDDEDDDDDDDISNDVKEVNIIDEPSNEKQREIIEELKTNNSSDDEQEEEIIDDIKISGESALDFSRRILNDKNNLSKFYRKCYIHSSPNPQGKILLNKLNHLTNYLVSLGFNSSSLSNTIESIKNEKFSSFQELNYVQLCNFVRSILEQYN